MSLQFDMARAEMDAEKAIRQWAVEAAENDLAADPDNEDLKGIVRCLKINLDLWNDYIDLLYPA